MIFVTLRVLLHNPAEPLMPMKLYQQDARVFGVVSSTSKSKGKSLGSVRNTAEVQHHEIQD